MIFIHGMCLSSVVSATVALGARGTVLALILIFAAFAAGILFGKGWRNAERNAVGEGGGFLKGGKRRRKGNPVNVADRETFAEAVARRSAENGAKFDPRIEGSRRLSALCAKGGKRETFEEAVERRSAENAAKKPEPPKEEPWSWL